MEIMNSIPHTIHYCWFGREEKPELVLRCIASWRKYMPHYEIREWNEDSYNVFLSKYSEEAYRLKSYAHVSDFARFWIIYHHGGIFLDTDVELLKPLDPLVEKGPFMAFEAQPEPPFSVLGIVNTGLGFAAYPGHPFIAEVLQHYRSQHFVLPNGKQGANVVMRVTKLLNLPQALRHTDGTVAAKGITIYPEEMFCPHNYYTGSENITSQTYTIHHYAASWVNRRPTAFSNALRRILNLVVRGIVTMRRAKI